jgi:hypothetical protein
MTGAGTEPVVGVAAAVATGSGVMPPILYIWGD